MSFLKNISDPSATDKELVLRYQESNNLELLATLYQRYMELVFGVCLKYLDDNELAKDAVMQIFEELVDKLKRHSVENFKSWLYTLAKNHCLMQLRSRKHKKTIPFNAELMQNAEEWHLGDEWPKEAALGRLERCLQTLSLDQQQAVDMFYLQQKCYNDIVTKTGLDWKKVRSLIQNGRRNLKICMDKHDE